MSDLNEFLTHLATDPGTLGQFILHPEGVMSEAHLAEEDRLAVLSTFADMMYARFSGYPVEMALKIPPPPPPPVWDVRRRIWDYEGIAGLGT